MPKPAAVLCACGSAMDYVLCCGRFIEQHELPISAEQLMRSRYTAYTLNHAAYLLDTWHPSTRPQHLHLDAAAPVKWIELTVKAISAGQPEQDQGTVSFVARYKVNGKAERLAEVSEFRKLDGRWYYVSGELS